MRTYRRFSNLAQMAVALCVFGVLALLLESGGLYDWAQRLELGPERTVALPVVTALHDGLVRLGIEGQRKRLLLELARIGWSDDPALLAAANAPAGKPALPGTNKVAPNAPGTPLVLAKPTTPTSNLPKGPPIPLAGAPPLNTPLPAIPGVAAGHQRTVALAGDSMMAVGLASTILRQAPNYKDLTFLRAFKSGTGLARPEVYNWQQEYPLMLKDARPEIVLVAIGTNDGQGFVDGGVTYPFGTDGWQKIYQARVEAYLQMLQANGATVIWLGLPPMKSESYNAKIALVNRIAYTVVSATPHAIWVSTGGTVGDASGQFRDFGEINQHTVRLRQSDGIHLSDEGATLVTAKLLPWLAAQQPEPMKSAVLDKPATAGGGPPKQR